MVGVIWMCSLVSVIAIVGVLYFNHEDKKAGNPKYLKNK